MALNSNPIVQVTFNSPDQMSCTLFLQNKIPGSSFKKINNTFDNVNGNIFSFIIDPTKPPIDGISLSDLSNCQLGWTVKCFDLDRNGRITFSFEIIVKDAGSNIMSTTITETSSDVTTSASGNTAVFEGSFTFP
jgi:hypothetical protein